MWPFFLTQTYDAIRTLRSSREAVLALLHDPERLFWLNPLVISVEKNSESPLSYTLIDDLTVFGHVKAKTTYTCTVKPLEDGVEHNIVAGLGTRSKNTFYVRSSSEDGVCELIQHTTTRGFFLFIWYIVRMQRSAHEKFRDNFQRALEGESCKQTNGDNYNG